VRYPRATYQAIPSDESDFAPAKTKIEARVTYALDGIHFAWLKLMSGEETVRAYDFELEAIASFRFNLEIATAAYKSANEKLPRILAVNITRMLYASAREMLSALTARAPHGSVVIEGVLIEPDDVAIRSDAPEDVVMRELFKVAMNPAKAISDAKVEKSAKKASGPKRAKSKLPSNRE